MAHITLMVPEGHTVQVHPPAGAIGVAHATGMIPNQATDGAKAAMDSALPAPEPKPQKKKVATALKKGAGSESAKK